MLFHLKHNPNLEVHLCLNSRLSIKISFCVQVLIVSCPILLLIVIKIISLQRNAKVEIDLFILYLNSFSDDKPVSTLNWSFYCCLLFIFEICKFLNICWRTIYDNKPEKQQKLGYASNTADQKTAVVI